MPPTSKAGAHAVHPSLLEIRMCDLALPWEGSGVARLADQLWEELQDVGFKHFRPEIYVADEWFSPDGVPAIAVPFYLLNPTLIRLEKSLMNEAEGESDEECMRLLRHEAGHAFDHAWGISRRRDFAAFFGKRPRTYDPDRYHADPDSRDFVVNLADHYAQAHPDEDFAETFAVWLDPRSDWMRRYRNWPKALAKLNWVDTIARELFDQKPKVLGGPRIGHISRLRRTLATHYATKQRDRLRHRRGNLAQVSPH